MIRYRTRQVGLGAVAIDGDVPPTSADQVSWWHLIAKWNATVRDYQAAYQQLLANRALAQYSPTLRAQVDGAIKTNAAVLARINSINAAFSDTKAWLQGAMQSVKNVWAYVSGSVSSLFGVPDRSLSVNLAGLGQVQLIPWAVGGAAVLYVAAKTADLIELNMKFNEARRLQASGMSPAASMAQVSQMVSAGGMFSGLTGATRELAILVGVGVAAFGGYHLMKSRQNQRKRPA